MISRHGAGKRTLRELATDMRIYEIRLRYRLVKEGPQAALKTHDDFLEYLDGAFDDTPLAETFYVISLNRRNRPIGRHRVSTGTATGALAHPREVYRTAILANACAVVCVHNHPSGDPTPSRDDIKLTRLLKRAGRAVDIPMLDHLILGNRHDDPKGVGFYSFKLDGYI